ncbi:hypothetical protein C2U69_04230 [Cupriavidus pinatubonensis]|nr:hypothetical protein C2U69_04230 [Cupriavidus pinatubonensis]
MVSDFLLVVMFGLPASIAGPHVGARQTTSVSAPGTLAAWAFVMHRFVVCLKSGRDWLTAVDPYTMQR